MPLPSPTAGDLHTEVARRLALVDQRYTSSRRALVEVLAQAGRPLSIPEILAVAGALPQSSAYRNITTLSDAGAVRRVAGNDANGRFELAEDLAGHHHHLLCTGCGHVFDIDAPPRLERAVAETARDIAESSGFAVDTHRLDLVGVCADCQSAEA
ncbi:MAG TPA: Fur family transcriptional regulator [Acidimicrobiales bacterium]